MLFLQLHLLAVLLPGGDNKDDFQEPVSFQIIQISSFYNSSWVQNLGSGWLDELQTHGWESSSGTIIFLWPWSKGNYSNEEWMELEKLFRMSSIGIPQMFHNLASQWQLELKPEAWLSTGPSPGPGRLMMVCHVSGFYPKPIWVMWMQGEQEHLGTQQSHILPNADGTWYLRKSLDVEALEAAGLSCRVRHSSLGGQDIIVYQERYSFTGWIFLALIVPLVLLMGLAFWLRKRWTHCEAPCTIVPLK
ncbi:T-cell surface glycoprotein CD1a isoform X1 [Equus caballus]|uniref:T-cell surface glycoprotein CD1a isoform X1 n=1 Tax=Equus caballus TaxID=9796 RepID=UPI0038B3E0DA